MTSVLTTLVRLLEDRYMNKLVAYEPDGLGEVAATEPALVFWFARFGRLARYWLNAIDWSLFNLGNERNPS